MRANSLVLSVLLEADDSMTSTMKCFKVIFISIQHNTVQTPDENFEA